MDRLLELVRQIGKLPVIGPDDVLMDAGFSSMNALQLLVEMEGAFNVTIPDEAFIAARTPRDLCRLVETLQQG